MTREGGKGGVGEGEKGLTTVSEKVIPAKSVKSVSRKDAKKTKEQKLFNPETGFDFLSVLAS
jgi:hypothetical protein